MALSLVRRADRGWTVVTLAGEIDATTVASLRRDLAAECVAEAGIVVDLSRVDFLDSAGLGVLVGALKRARACGGTLQLVCPECPIRNVLTMTGLTKVFDIHETLDEPAGGPSDPPGDRPRSA